MQSEIDSLLKQSKGCLYLSGRGGSGKSHMIREFLTACSGTAWVVAPTGMAALNVKGRTIHSAFGFAPVMQDIGPNHGLSSDIIDLLELIPAIVIDEVSMVRADLLDRIDLTMQEVRGNTLPFGGVPTVLVADHFQLPPVADENWDVPHLERIYGSDSRDGFFFQSFVFQRLVEEGLLTCVKLDRNFRQAPGEVEYRQILDRIRIGQITESDLGTLNERARKMPDNPWQKLQIVPTRNEARLINKLHLEMPGPPVVKINYQYEVVSDVYLPVLEENPMFQTLRLRIGSRVMFCLNDALERWRNGTRGTVMGFGQHPSGDVHAITVLIDGSGELVTLEPAVAEMYVPLLRADRKGIAPKCVGRVQQFPLIPAHAITIHKAQGLSMDEAIVSMGRGAFCSGQTYVALSRIRKLEGLYLTSAIRPAHVFVDPLITQFDQWMESVAMVLN